MTNYMLLQKKLPHYQIECKKGFNTPFFHCNALTNSTVCTSGTLYIGYSKHLRADFFNDDSIGFLLLDRPNIDISNTLPTFLFINTPGVDILELLYEVQCIFQELTGFLNDSSLLINGFLQEKSIPELIDIGSRLLGNPIMLTNASFKVVYMTKNEQIEDKVWQDAQRLGCCSAESILVFKQDKASITLFNSEKSFIYQTGLGEQMPRILKKISTLNKVLGYIVVFQVNQKLEDHHLEITDFFSKLLAIEMKNNLTDDTTDKIYESLIIDLLQNKKLSNFSLTNRLQSTNWSIRPILRIIYIEVDAKKTLDYYFEYITIQLQRINPFAKVVRFYEHIIVVLNYNSANEYELIASQITELLEQLQLYSGYSRTFSTLPEIHAHYLQAKAALSLGKLLQNNTLAFYYKDFCLYHLLSCMENDKLPGLCSTHYITLSQYDKINSTEYCDTLYQYILSATNISAAAKSLQIHRNTMTYRMEKIAQISELDLSNGEELYQFYISNNVMKWLNNCK